MAFASADDVSSPGEMEMRTSSKIPISTRIVTLSDDPERTAVAPACVLGVGAGGGDGVVV